ncbi:DUF1549 domain-containing protein, partial [Armatimonas sp.]|uniref:DUF1549 domain-containing protein n=1 Tax=Armatimonas sp. TaxID=1872638 RepID=UPI00286D3C1A
GSLAHSRMWERITSKDADDRMPPQDPAIRPLTPEKIAILKQWIEEGAGFKGHWAFIPPVPPAIPKIKNPTWAKNPIDNFIAEKLAASGFKPEGQADKPTLIRRVSLALTGLPPKTEEVEAFLKDSSPLAYEKMVDRFLSSSGYGEHQARYWLDAVRYGDTHGLHLDNERGIWPYRDWVVSALNRDVPFDKMTVWQLAGDLLPNPTQEQRLATGFVRMNPTTAEGGAIVEEFLVKNTVDRVDTTTTVYLGITMACARCHDHKYDPFTAKDYYSMFAFLNNTTDDPMDGNSKVHPPVLKVPTKLQSMRLLQLKNTEDSLFKGLDLSTARAWASKGVRLPKVGNWEISTVYSAANYKAAYDQVFAPETEQSGTWKPTKVANSLALNGIVKKDNAAVYLRTTFTPEKAGDFTIRVQSDDGLKVWQDGKLVHGFSGERSVSEAGGTVTLTLHEGPNKLLFKIVNATGSDGFNIGYGTPADVRIMKLGPIAAK